MRIIECDRCHKRIKGVSKTGYINLDLRDTGSGELDGSHEFDEWDLCEDCMRLIRDFVRNVPEKPKATIKKMPVEGRTITKPDWIRNLAKEGKTVKEICELTGCSELTARKYKAEVTTNDPVHESDEG